MSFGSVRNFHWKPGGANEAVIRMLISIGRLVVKTLVAADLFIEFSQPGKCTGLYRSGKEAREDLVWVWSQVGSKSRILFRASYTAFRVYKTVRPRRL